MAAKVDKSKCNGCGNCVEVCPCEAITLDSDIAKVKADDCTDCGACVDECSCQAIILED